MDLHTAASDFDQRTPLIASMYASNLLDHIVKSIEQSAAGKPVPGALGRPSDRVLFLSGHDTNIATVAGSLRLDWIIDGRRDDTPPGGTLVFELWRASSSGEDRVRFSTRLRVSTRCGQNSRCRSTPAPCSTAFRACMQWRGSLMQSGGIHFRSRESDQPCFHWRNLELKTPVCRFPEPISLGGSAASSQVVLKHDLRPAM